MNKCMFTGRFTRDPEVRYTQGDKPTAIAHFTLAVDRDYKVKEGDPTADFPRFTAFGKRAEFIGKYCKQGTKVEVESEVQTGSYKNRDGQTVYTVEFRVDNCRFAESKKSSGAAAPAPTPTSAPETAPAPAPADDFLAGFYDEGDDLPFMN